jgi:hypothetical protein
VQGLKWPIFAVDWRYRLSWGVDGWLLVVAASTSDGDEPAWSSPQRVIRGQFLSCGCEGADTAMSVWVAPPLVATVEGGCDAPN